MLDSIQTGDVVRIGEEVYTVYGMADSQRGRVIAERQRDKKMTELNVELLMFHGVKVEDDYDEPRYEVYEPEDDRRAVIYQPHHYADREVEAIDIIESVIDGLPAKEGMLLAHILRYALRAGVKTPDWTVDTGKANNYAHRLITGEWRK